MSNLIISLSPHNHGKDSVERNMYGVLIALVPALLVSFVSFGLGSVVVCLTSVSACVLFEWAITRFLLKRPSTIADGSAILTGILLGMNLPSNLPIWIILIGALFAIGVGKMTFGGLGCNPFNPALIGRCVLLVSFPAQMTSWPIAGQGLHYLDATTGATPLALMKQAVKTGNAEILTRLPDSFTFLFGNGTLGGGSLGEACIAALLLGGIFLLVRKIITWHIPVSILLTVFVISGIFHLISPAYPAPLQEMFSGGLMLGAIFMATDYVTSPMTHRGQLIYGIGIGILTVCFRFWSAYPEGVSFSILIMNGATPLINNYIKPRHFGEGASK